MKKNIGILIANWAGVNIGDDAIFSVLLKIIHTEVSKTARIFVLADNDKAIRANYHIKDAARLFDFYKLCNLEKTVRFLKDSDLVIYGGGDVISGNIKSMSFLAMAKILGLPIMCCSVGVIPLKFQLKRVFTRIVLNHADLITVRDPKSEERLRELGVNKPQTIVTSDLAFLLSPNVSQNKLLQEINQHCDNSKIKVGISVRPFDPMYSSYKIWTEDKLIIDMPTVCDYIIEKYNATLVFIPMVSKKRTRDYHRELKCDDELSRQIVEKMKNKGSAIVINADYPAEDLMGLLSEMQMVIAARLHVLLLASVAKVPVIALEYAPKIKSFMALMNRARYSLDMNKLTKTNLMNLIDKVMSERDKGNSTDLKRYVERAEVTGGKINEILKSTKRNYGRFYLFLPIVPLVTLLNYIHSIAQRLYNHFYGLQK
ncbi:MAG: polysaccharide pyruvyl transferase family protein [Thermodesulfobacteriota bacterium]|nr:polysaccharide pyruvyl transferase family protein [Thermodesulfobacteriota bacterium]